MADTIKSGITNSPFIGVSNFHVAKLLTDPAGGTATYDTMISFPWLRQVQIQPQTNEQTLYVDDAAIASSNVISKYNLTIDTADFPLEYKALILGHTFDSTTGTMNVKSTDTAPYFMIAFQSNKANGGCRYVKFAKVKFAEPQENSKTKEENISYNTPQMTATAIYRDSDHVALMQADTEATGYVEDTGKNWYSTTAASTGA